MKKEVVKRVERDRSTVSRYVHEFEAAVGAVKIVINAQEQRHLQKNLKKQ